MAYPRPSQINRKQSLQFVPGEWYTAIIDYGTVFTANYDYLCVSGRNGGEYLVSNKLRLVSVFDMQRHFSHAE